MSDKANKQYKNPNSHKAAHHEKRAATSSLLDASNSDEEKQRTAGKSALNPRAMRTTSAAKKPRTEDANAMDAEPLVPISDTSSSPVVYSALSPSQTAAPVLTAADNGTLSTARNGSSPQSS